MFTVMERPWVVVVNVHTTALRMAHSAKHRIRTHIVSAKQDSSDYCRAAPPARRTTGTGRVPRPTRQYLRVAPSGYETTDLWEAQHAAGRDDPAQRSHNNKTASWGMVPTVATREHC